MLNVIPPVEEIGAEMNERSKKNLLVAYDADHLPVFKEMAGGFNARFLPLGYSELLSVIPEYDYLIPSVKYRLDMKLLSGAAKLKAISTPSTGTDHIDFEACKTLGIEVFSLKNDTDFLSGITATAELAFCHILNSVRRFPAALNHVLAGEWNSSRFCGRELQGKTLGIVGFGRLGKIMSEYARAFRMSVIAYDPYKNIKTEGVRQVIFDDLLKSADIISLHLHLNDETKGLIGRHAFQKMKRGVIIVNTSRGAIIDSGALISALEDGTVAGAGIDVIDNELGGNISVHPLVEYARNHDNLIITPHMGGVTVDSQQKAFVKALEKLINFDAVFKANHTPKQQKPELDSSRSIHEK